MAIRSNDGQDIITDSDGINDVIRFSDINSNQVILTKDSDNLVITFSDADGNLTIDNITNQMLSNEVIENFHLQMEKNLL